MPLRPKKKSDPDELMRRFGRNVERLRNQRGLSQHQLAAMVKTHRTWIAHIERGSSNCTIRTIARLAQALGVTPAELLS